MSFWKSNLGELTGESMDAFAKSFKSIPDGTLALARIESFTKERYDSNEYYQIDWLLTAGDFKGFHVFQKIKAFNLDDKVRHRALNMLMLIYKLFDIKPTTTNAPQNNDLLIFKNRIAGIKIQETEPNENGKIYNWVSEVHHPKDFVCETGVKLEVVHVRPDVKVSEDDVPF